MKLIEGNFRQSYIRELFELHEKYNMPITTKLFMDDLGYTVNNDSRTKN